MSVLKWDGFVEDFGGAVDGGIVHEGESDAIAGASIDFDDVASIADILFDEETCVEDGVFDVVDDDLFNADVETLEDEVHEIVSEWSGFIGAGEEHLEHATDAWVCVDGEAFFFGFKNDDRIGARLHDFVEGHLYEFR